MKTLTLAILFAVLCLIVVLTGGTFAVCVSYAVGGGSFGLLCGLAAAVIVGWAALPLLGAVVDA